MTDQLAKNSFFLLSSRCRSLQPFLPHLPMAKNTGQTVSLSNETSDNSSDDLFCLRMLLLDNWSTFAFDRLLLFELLMELLLFYFEFIFCLKSLNLFWPDFTSVWSDFNVDKTWDKTRVFAEASDFSEVTELPFTVLWTILSFLTDDHWWR